jgi:hypothetical protein
LQQGDERGFQNVKLKWGFLIKNCKTEKSFEKKMARTKSYLLSLVTKNIKISNSNRLNNEFIETKIKINNC